MHNINLGQRVFNLLENAKVTVNHFVFKTNSKTLQKQILSSWYCLTLTIPICSGKTDKT